MSTLNRITELLNESGKKQIDLTNYLGISKNVFTAWKSGKNTSYKGYISEIAEFFGVSSDYLLCRTNSKACHPKCDDNKQQLYAYAFAGEPGAKSIELDISKLEKLNILVNTARDLSDDKIQVLINAAEAMKS